MRKRPCMLFACIFLTGIVFQRYDWKWLCLVPFVFLILEIYYGVNFYMDKQGNNSGILIWRRIVGRSLVLLSAFFLGISHMKSEEDFRNTYMLKLENGQEAIVFGEILTTQETEYGVRLLLTDCYVSLKETTLPCNQVMAYVSSDQYQSGQVYQIKGKIQLFEHARNEGNFDSALFYQSQKIDFSIYASECILLGCEKNALRDAILELKMHLREVYQNTMKEEAAGFYVGMMLGDKSLLSERTKDLFAVGGISHILAISGLHMSIIGRGFYKFLRKNGLGFCVAGIMASLVLFAYCYMVGSGTSAVRAVGMMVLFFMAQHLGRSYDMLNSLGAIVIYLLWENPFLIEYSGFQFSVAALIGVGFVGQTLSSGLERGEEQNEKVVSHEKERKSEGISIINFFCKMRKRFSGSIWMSMGITLTTLPIVASCYFEVPLYSPLVNSLVLPMLTPVFGLAILGGLAGCVFPAVGRVVLIPCEGLYAFYELVCQFVADLPFGSVITGKTEMKMLVLYYLVLFTGILILKKMKTAREELLLSRERMLKYLLSILCFFLILYPQKAKSEIIFLDVGQGDGIYIGSEDGTTCFIDGGSSDVNEVGRYRILPFLKAHGVRRIDYWFVSHADTDHMSGLLEVMETGYEIRHLVVSDKMPEDESSEKLLDLAKQQGISMIHIKAGECIQSVGSQKNILFSREGICITSLYPWADATDKNEQSLVLLVEFFDRNEGIYKALFSGDISAKVEAELIRKGVLEDVDLYKAAHHGSKHSNSKAFLEIIQPEICVISCGADNSYGHPHAEAVQNIEMVGVEIVYTMESGQITIQKNKDRVGYTKEIE